MSLRDKIRDGIVDIIKPKLQIKSELVPVNRKNPDELVCQICKQRGIDQPSVKTLAMFMMGTVVCRVPVCRNHRREAERKMKEAPHA